MENVENLFGSKFRSLRIRQGITLKQLSEIVQIDSSDLSRMERGLIKPSLESIERISNVLNLDNSELNQLKILGEYPVYEDVEISTDSTEIDDSKAITIEVKTQLQDLKDNIDKLKTQLEGKQSNTNNDDLIDQLNDYKIQLTQVQANSQQATAKINVPDVEIDMIPTTEFLRIEEHRVEETKWFTVFGLFLGSIIGFFVNLSTGGQITESSWPILSVLAAMALFTGFTGYKYRKKSIDTMNEIKAPNK